MYDFRAENVYYCVEFFCYFFANLSLSQLMCPVISVKLIIFPLSVIINIRYFFLACDKS